MTRLVSHALINAGAKQGALAGLCRMMILVQDVIELPEGTVAVLFDPGMPDTPEGFGAFCAALHGVAPGLRIEAVIGRFEDLPAARLQSLTLLTQAIETLTAARPSTPATVDGLPAFLVAYHGWRHAMGVLRASARDLDHAVPRLMVS